MPNISWAFLFLETTSARSVGGCWLWMKIFYENILRTSTCCSEVESWGEFDWEVWRECKVFLKWRMLLCRYIDSIHCLSSLNQAQSVRQDRHLTARGFHLRPQISNLNIAGSKVCRKFTWFQTRWPEKCNKKWQRLNVKYFWSQKTSKNAFLILFHFRPSV